MRRWSPFGTGDGPIPFINFGPVPVGVTGRVMRTPLPDCPRDPAPGSYRILLIAPASGPWHGIGRRGWFNGRTFRFSLLSLLSLAAETPPGADVRILDEQVDLIREDEPADLVGITCMTAAAPRAYALAARFRARGVPVVLGGMHPTLCPDEARQHADAIVIGDAEGTWPRLVEDARGGRLQAVYRAAVPPSLAGLRRPPRHLLAGARYATVQAVQATRGCPHGCDFCSVAAYHNRTQRQRPIEEVIAEVGALPGRFVVFVDDNLAADRDYARRLFEQLAPLGKQWISQVTLGMADDPDLVRLASAAGCVGVFVGLESFQGQSLGAVGKSINRTERYREAIRCFHAHGIGVEAGIVVGLPGEGPESFRHTLALLDEFEVDAVQVSISTPLPGTPRFTAMQDRLTSRDWSQYDFHHVVFEPDGMSGAALKAGHDWLTREFYRPWRIARRVWRHLHRPRAWAGVPYLVGINLAYFGRVCRWRIRGCDPAPATGPGRPQLRFAAAVRSLGQRTVCARSRAVALWRQSCRPAIKPG